MIAKLTDLQSIPQVIAELTLEEKLNLVGAYRACNTLAIPERNIPALNLTDGVTGVNGAQVVIDHITAPGIKDRPEVQRRMSYATPELVDLNRQDPIVAREKFQNDPEMLELIDHVAKMRPGSKDYISFPSGINIGASFDPDAATRIGRAVGWEMRDSGVDICLGPNVDIARDPLGGRNYEMYGEDPQLVSQMAVGFICGLQSTGVGACAKHFLANNQETNRNTVNVNVSERALKEIYGRGFENSIKQARVKSIMSAYNSINGKFSTYNKELLTDWLREEWGFEGLVVSDWGAASQNKEDALMAGLDLILCGPNDMTACQTAVETGQLPETILNERVYRILKTIVEVREEKIRIPAYYKREELLQEARTSIAEGAVLLKNEGDLLPLGDKCQIAFYGKRSKEFMECGTGSTSVVTSLSSNIYDETIRRYPDTVCAYESMEGADTLVYAVCAPAGENVDRRSMNIEEEDRLRLPRVLREAKEKGLKTVVLLNIAGPIEMQEWLDDADSVLSLFIPGCMGGVTAVDLLFGEAYPGGKLPVTFPVHYEDTPAYPNFPGEGSDIYYGEGIFVGYRSYEKRNLPVQFPFGFGLSYTRFSVGMVAAPEKFDTLNQDWLDMKVRVKNIGDRIGSEVIQVYGTEKKPHVLRPKKELLGFAKAELMPGEEKELCIRVTKEPLRYFDANKRKWVLPVGEYRLMVGTSSADILWEQEIRLLGVNEYALGGSSTIGDVIKNPEATQLVNTYTGGFFDMVTEENLAFMINDTLADVLGRVLIGVIPDAVRLNDTLQELYNKLKECS